MSNKTAAELQMDFLKKLREEQKKKSPGRQGFSVQKRSTRVKKTKKAKRRARALSMPAKAWERLSAGLAAQGISPIDKRLGPWAVELLISIPISLMDANEELKLEIFRKVSEWSGSRGIK